MLRRPLRLSSAPAAALLSAKATQLPQATPAAEEGWWDHFSVLKDAEPIGRGSYAQRLATFEDWLTARGARFGDLALRLSPASGATRGQGCAGFAKRDLAVGDVVVDLPLDGCLLSAAAAKASAVGHIAAASGVDEHDGNLYLAVALLDLWAQQKAQRQQLGAPGDASRGLTDSVGAAGLSGCAVEAVGEAQYRTDFGPYLDVLPRRLPHVPLFWSPADLARLQGSPLREAVEVRRACVAADFANLQAEARRRLGAPTDAAAGPSRQRAGQASTGVALAGGPEGERAARVLLAATAADYAVAEATVCSRAFLVPRAGLGGRAAHCLVPLADMLNTALPHTCDVDFGTKLSTNSSSGSGSSSSSSSSSFSPSPSPSGTELRFVMACVRAVARGAQVHDSYGLKSNDRFLMSYGFSLDHNVR
jgi:hypothetical protein